MCQLCRRDYKINRETHEKIKNIIHKIIKEILPSKIILFGSFARGDWHEQSDVDLLIVADTKERFFERIGKVLDLNDTDLELEPLVYTPFEFERMVREERPFIMNILDEGIVVY